MDFHSGLLCVKCADLAKSTLSAAARQRKSSAAPGQALPAPTRQRRQPLSSTAHRHPIQFQRRLTDAYRHALALFTTDTNAGIQF